MSDWLDRYAAADDRNEKYRLLRAEAARLRGQAGGEDFYDHEAVADSLRRLSDRVEGRLLAFVANDFGSPAAYRPSGVDPAVQDEVRRAILQDKYDDAHADLDDVRRRLLDEHPGIHKAIVAEYDEGAVRYHLPEGSKQRTSFLTVREMVGLVDYTTNSAQSEGLSRTY